MKMTVILFSLTLFLQGCTYAISPGMADRADKTIPFEKLQADPDAYKGKLLILGGTIAQTTTVNQGTLFEVDRKKLDYWGKPIRTKRSGGRFFAFFPGYLNAMAYAPGVDVTIAGEVLGTGSPLIGDRRYDDPVVIMKEIKLWEREHPAHDNPTWMDPLSDDPRSPGGRE